MNEQLYLKVEDSPIDEEDLKDLNIPIYKFNNIDYVKINICEEFKEEWAGFIIVDIELTEMKENENQGGFNGMGFNSKKDFFPIYTELIIKEGDLK